MCRPQFAVGHPAAHAAEFDVGVRVGHVGLDLFERPPGQEGGCTADKGDQAAVGQSGPYTDHVLLGDAHVDEPDRVHLAELVQLARADRVVDDGDDALILRCELAELIFKGIATIIELGHDAPSSSSLRAVASSSALGTRWCQAALSRMNETPCPLCVCAMMQFGLPGSNGMREWSARMERETQEQMRQKTLFDRELFFAIQSEERLREVMSRYDAEVARVSRP